MSPATKTTKLLVAGVALMVVAGLGPWIILTLAGLLDVASVAILPAVSLTIACVTGSGWRVGLYIVGPFAVLAGLATWASPYPLLAGAVLALAAFLRAYSAREGQHNALILTVVTLGFLVATPPTFEGTVSGPIVVALVTLGSGLWAIVVVLAVSKWLPHPKALPLDAIRTLAYSVVLAVLVGAATFLVSYFELGQTGGWIILTILVVFQPYFGASFKKGRDRALGTLAGLAITVLIGLIFPTGPILYAFGSIFIVITFLFILQGRPYWLYAVALTPAVVLLDSANSRVDLVAMERLKGTLVGIAFTLLVMLALSPFAKHLEVKPSAQTQAPKS